MRLVISFCAFYYLHWGFWIKNESSNNFHFQWCKVYFICINNDSEIHANASVIVKVLGGISFYGGKLETFEGHTCLLVVSLVLDQNRVLLSARAVICCPIYHWLSVSRQWIYHSRLALVIYPLHDWPPASDILVSMTLHVFLKNKEINNAVELQWLEHLWDYENLFETGIVRPTEVVL